MPKNIGAGVIASQHLPFHEYCNRFVSTIIAIPKRYKVDIEKQNNNFNIVYYDNYNELKVYIKRCDWVYIRNLYTFMFVILMRIITSSKIKIYYDFRSLSYIEILYTENSKFKSVLFFIVEYLAFQLSSARSTVSFKLRDCIKKKLGSKSINVIPCGIQNVKNYENVISRKIDNERIRFVYLGSINMWQCFDETLSLYKSISDELRLPSSLTIITNDKVLAEEKIRQIMPNERIKVMSLTHNEVDDLLPSFDFGFLIRENSPINNLASPIKFLEYTSNGITPIMSNHIGDYSDEMIKYGLGIVLKNYSNIVTDEIVRLNKNKEHVKSLLVYSKGYLLENFWKNHPMIKSIYENTTSD